VVRELEVPEIWNDLARAQALGKERSTLEQVVNTIRTMDSNLGEAADLLEMAAEEDDQETVDAVIIGIFFSRIVLSQFTR